MGVVGVLSWPLRYSRRNGKRHLLAKRADGYVMRGETATLLRSVLREMDEGVEENPERAQPSPPRE